MQLIFELLVGMSLRRDFLLNFRQDTTRAGKERPLYLENLMVLLFGDKNGPDNISELRTKLKSQGMPHDFCDSGGGGGVHRDEARAAETGVWKKACVL